MSKNDMNLKKIKSLFPIFNKSVNGHQFAYFDSASTAQMPQTVIDAVTEYYSGYKANVGRGIYAFAEQSTQAFEDARTKIAKFIGAKQQEVIITAGATDGINQVARAWAQRSIKKGDEIIVSEVEHHSNFVPWQQLAVQKGAVLKVVPVNDQGVVDPEILQMYLSEKTKLVAIIYTSNMLGTVNDIQEMTKRSHSFCAKILVDATQTVAHQAVDVKQLNCDFLVFSGHKLFGPTGVGVLYIKESLLDQVDLMSFGGGMVYSVSQEKTTFKKVPHCFESGTQPIAQVIGLAVAIDFIQNQISSYALLQKHETRLVLKLAQFLGQLSSVKILSHVPQGNQKSNVVTFVSEKFHAHDIAAYLDQYGIAVRAGHHCVQPYHQKFGLNASVRVSFSLYNDMEEVDFLIEKLQELLR